MVEHSTGYDVIVVGAGHAGWGAALAAGPTVGPPLPGPPVITPPATFPRGPIHGGDAQPAGGRAAEAYITGSSPPPTLRGSSPPPSCGGGPTGGGPSRGLSASLSSLG